jgi:hypothetical protein
MSQEPSMPNVLWRLFHRQPVREAERSSGDRVLAALPAAPGHADPGAVSTAFDSRPVEAANDSKPFEAPHDLRPVEPAADPKPAIDSKPAKSARDEDTVELQIAALLSAWDKTSLRARRAFLTRIDQRIMTTLRIRSVPPGSGGQAAAG